MVVKKKCAIGTKVVVKSFVPHYATKEAVIVGVERGYKHFNEEDGTFVEDGLLTLEKTIKHICIPYEFNDDTLKVHHEGYTSVSKFYDYYYVIRVLEGDQLVTISSDRFDILSEPTELEQKLIQHLIELHESVGAHLPVYLRGVIYAYDATAYRNLPQIKLTEDQWLDEDFKYHIKDRGFLSIFESKIILTETAFMQAEPLAVLVFN